MTLDDLRAYSEAMHAPSFNQMIRERRKDSYPLFAELKNGQARGFPMLKRRKTVNRYKARDGFDYLDEAHGVLVGLNGGHARPPRRGRTDEKKSRLTRSRALPFPTCRCMSARWIRRTDTSRL